ncbi:MAG: hypothetical protein UR14_C0010G0001, partial [candidate division TM6 bacterium GW2011_GWE2_31_21]
MKKIMILIAIVIAGISILTQKKSAYAYVCPVGYYCVSSGSVRIWVYLKTLNSCGAKFFDSPCSGTDNDCHGIASYTGYSSMSDCLAGINEHEITAGCCNKATCTSTCVSNCSPGACLAGYTKDKNLTGILCRTQYTSSVSCSNSGSSCPPSAGCGSNTDTCYLLETNTTFIQSNGSTSGPTSVSMIVDGKTYSLSTDPANPTHIALPAKGSSNVQLTAPTFTAPTTSRGANYYYQANNYGNDNEWKTWTSCNADEDFCTTMPNANNTQAFDPTTLTVNQVLKEGALGEISAMYATTDKCADTYKYSLPTKGYYVVDYIPDPPDPCPPGDPTCTWIPEIGTNITTRGCTSLTYSGTEINNELHINAGVTDTDSLDEIQALTLWFSKDTNVPTVGTISASYSGSVNTDLGIMIKKNGSDWNNPNIYTTNSDLTWGLISLTDGVGYIN